MGKSSSSSQSSVPASSVSSSKVTFKTPQPQQSKQSMQSKKKITLIVHVTPVKNEKDEIICTILLNSYCIRDFLNSCKGANGYKNKLISTDNLTSTLEICSNHQEVEITNTANELQLDRNQITDISGIFFPTHLGTYHFCNVITSDSDEATKNFFKELDVFDNSVFNDKTIKISYHIPHFTTKANDFYVKYVLSHFFPENNEDNNELNVVPNGYLSYF